jgi:hypothetical protein
VFLLEPTAELRQGDICLSWIVPKWQLNDQQMISNSDRKVIRTVVGVHSQGAELPLAICSHDCELENPRGRMGVVVAPVLLWPFDDMSSDSSLDLVGSSALQDDSYTYVNLFPIKLPSRDGEAEDWRVVDFSAMTTVVTAAKAALVLRKGKHLEMTDESRLLFKRKLAAFFGR